MSDLLNQNPLPCYVGGAAFEGASGSFTVLDPHSGKELHKVSSVTAADVPKVVEAAEKAFPGWKAVSCLPSALLQLIADALHLHRRQ